MMEDIQVDGVAINLPTVTNKAEPSTAHNDTSDSSQQSQENVLYSEFERLKTFPRLWTHALQKRDLAKNGFHYVQETTETKCVFCVYVIVVVHSQDSVDNLHKLNSQGCDFAHGRDVSKNIPLGYTSDYRYEKNRVVSFLGAHWYAPVDIYDLAKYGFYWTGVADTGRCNFCRLEVRGWEPNDRGQSEHLRWNPHCPFMQDRAVGNVPLGEENNAAHVVDDGVAVAQNVNVTNPNGRSVAELGVMLTAPPRHPEYATIAARLASYAMWPLSMPQRPEQLAEAGFYYISKGDRVICFQCGGGLKDWGQTDLPWVEHAVWFPRCAFLLVKKGREFVAQVQALKNAQLSNQELQALTQSSISSHQPAVPRVVTTTTIASVGVQALAMPGPMNHPSNFTSQAPTAVNIDGNAGSNNAPVLSSEAEEARDMWRMCRVCSHNELGIVLLTCGHVATCPDCAPRLISCPICVAHTKAYIRIYIP